MTRRACEWLQKDCRDASRTCDIDMIVSDSETLECSIYEVKHSTERHLKQPRHILDPEKSKRLEAKYGTIRREEVLYRGKSGTFGGVSYRNVNEYLFGISS